MVHYLALESPIGRLTGSSSEQYWQPGSSRLRLRVALASALQACFLNNLLTGFVGRVQHVQVYCISFGRVLLLYKSLAVHARWCWTLKTWIDRKFLKQFQC
jgi:selenide,water dikinase